MDESPAFPIERITRIGEIRSGAHHSTRCTTRPGHLIHLMEEGEYDVVCDGRAYHQAPGDILYYHDAEDVQWVDNPVPVRFLTVGFYAPTLAPPPLEARQCRSTDPMRKALRALYDAYLRAPSLARDLTIYSELCQLLALLPLARGIPGEMRLEDEAWWQTEHRLRAAKAYRPVLASLAREAGVSVSTLSRICRRATGQSPMQRVRTLRLQEARGMLLYSSLPVGEIARQLGYPRVHEFSREFARWAGEPPSALRRR